MRYTSASSTKRTSGFTLIEMLIIAPIVILAIGAFITLMVSMTGTVLMTRDRNTLTYDIQNALDQVEQDVRISTQFQTTTGTVTAPQGSNDSTAAFTSSSALILTSLTTDKSPLDGARQLVYYANQPNACGSQETYNRLFQTTIVYYLKNGSLWRRVILPTYNTNSPADGNTVCRTPWQRNSCTPGYTTSPPCQTTDSEVMQNVDSFSVKYYSDPGSSTDLGTGSAKLASTIEMTINGKKMTGGKSVTTSGSMRATKLNVTVDTPPPTTPSVIYNIATPTTPSTVTFNWSGSATATSYAISYAVNGSSWTNTTVNSNTSAYTVNVDRGDTVTFKIAAINGAGTSPNSVTTVSVPIWSDYTLQSNWKDFTGSGGYATHAFTRTKSGLVVLRGLVQSGDTTTWAVIGNLPPGYRPAEQMLYAIETSSNVNGRVDVKPNGDIAVVSASTNWISLDNIRFMPSGTSWTSIPLQSPWVYWGSPYATPGVTETADGMVVLKGLVKGGANGSVIGILPAGYRPAERLLFADETNNQENGRIDILPTGEILSQRTDPGWVSLDNIQFMPSGTSWTPLALQAPWQRYSTTWASPAYTKTADGMVDVKGLISGGANGSLIAVLPAGYRPSARLLFQVETNANVAGRIDVLPTGEIYSQATDPGWAGLDNISFKAEQ